jgi:(p)ppGpp synthase/HD superfamily hydrolase
MSADLTSDRGSAMAASLARAAQTHGVDGPGVALLSRANALAMAPRVERLDDDHHPLYLHPGRTALILLRDAGVTDAKVLAAACVTESEDEIFAVDEGDIRAALGDQVARLVAALPRPRSSTWVEDLVIASEHIRLVVLAERLDHLRHAHLRAAGGEWERTVHVEGGSVYLPLAERTNPTLARRYRHWHRTFARRLGLA